MNSSGEIEPPSNRSCPSSAATLWPPSSLKGDSLTPAAPAIPKLFSSLLIEWRARYTTSGATAKAGTLLPRIGVRVVWKAGQREAPGRGPGDLVTNLPRRGNEFGYN